LKTRAQAELPPEQPGSRPRLSAVQLSVLRRYGTKHAVPDGEVLFADGDGTYDLIVVLEGELEIIERAPRFERLQKPSSAIESGSTLKEATTSSRMRGRST
jgi:hypothetical protein